ncbi:MAG: secretin N-terminal domain-containing protein, partial [Phycisphaerae bacterium]
AMVDTLKSLYGGGKAGQSDIVITGNEPTNTIVVRAPEPVMVEIRQQIDQMDAKIGGDKALRTIKLAVADAEKVAQKLTEVFGESRRGGRRGTAQKISIDGVKQNNTLYIRCAEEMFPQIEQVARDMDHVDDGMQVKRFQLEHAAAQDVVHTLEQMMMKAKATGGMGTTKLDLIGIVPDPRTNSLIVTGGPMTMMLMDRMLAEIDVPPSEFLERTFMYYEFPKGVDVNLIVRNINEVFRGDIRKTGVEAPKVTANIAAGLITVEANTQQHERIKKSIIDPILKNVGEPAQEYIYPVKNAQATVLARTLTQQIRATMTAVSGKFPINVIGDDAANTLLISASPANYEKLLATIGQLDVPPSDVLTQVFKCKYIAPWTMANIINSHFRTATRNPNEKVTASSEDGTMSLIVSANKENMAKVAELIEKTDKPSSEKETRFVQVQNARADELARTMTQSLQLKTLPDRRGRYPFSINADVASNVLVVTAEAYLFDEIDAMILRLDVPPQGADEIEKRIFRMTYADPGSVQRVVNEMFRPAGGLRNAAPRDIVTASVDWTTNSAIVSAAPEKMKEIEELIQSLDKPGSAKRTYHVIEVANSNTSDVANSLQQIFNAANRGRRQQSSATIKAIKGSTKLAIYANEEEFAQIQDLVRQIDVEGGRVIHTITIADTIPAKSVTDNINALFGSGGRGGNRGDGPKAECHEPTNTILISATEQEFEKISSVIEKLSELPAQNKLNFYKIRLRYAVADEVATTLQDFFDKKAGIGRDRNRGRNRGFGGAFFISTGSSSKQDEIDNLVTIMAEPTSNMLLVYCTETTKTLIDDLLVDIDVDPGIDRVVEMVALEYVDATVMIDILTEVLKVTRRSEVEDSRDNRPWWAPQQPEDDKVVLAGDTRLKAIEASNSIIIAGRREAVADALEKIKELDVPGEGDQPQMYKFVHANATEVADILKNVFGEGSSAGRSSRGGGRRFGGRFGGRRGGGGSASASQPLKIEPITATNAILVKGKASDVNDVLDMARLLDEEM